MVIFDPYALDPDFDLESTLAGTFPHSISALETIHGRPTALESWPATSVDFNYLVG
jgi:hypothetical protein